MAQLTYRQAIAAALAQEMARDDRVVVLGEDVASGGVFKTTVGLRERFGPQVAMPPVAAERSLFGRKSQGVAAFGPEALFGMAPQGLAQGLAEDIISALEARAMWARFGL